MKGFWILFACVVAILVLTVGTADACWFHKTCHGNCAAQEPTLAPPLTTAESPPWFDSCIQDNENLPLQYCSNSKGKHDVPKVSPAPAVPPVCSITTDQVAKAGKRPILRLATAPVYCVAKALKAHPVRHVLGRVLCRRC